MGRQGETYGEDAALAAALGAAYVAGLQTGGDRTRSDAVAKHFLGFHHSEGGIHGAHCDIPDRLLIEVYGKPFQAAITLAGLRGVMPCYSSVGGEPVSGSPRILTELLREQMGFDGVAVADYGAIGNLHTVQRVAESYPHAGLLALTAGLDAEFHVPLAFTDELAHWFTDGRADIAVLDQAVLRVLTAKFRMGLFDHPFALTSTDLERTFHGAGDADVSLRSARESIILLGNDGVLPLSPVKRLAVIGCHAVTARFFFGGYTHFSMSEGMLAANASMAGLAGGQQRRIEHTVPGTGIQADDDPAFEELLHRQQPGIRNLLQELTERLPDTEVVWARGYPIAGDDVLGPRRSRRGRPERRCRAAHPRREARHLLDRLHGRGHRRHRHQPPRLPGLADHQAGRARHTADRRAYGRAADLQRHRRAAPQRHRRSVESFGARRSGHRRRADRRAEPQRSASGKRRPLRRTDRRVLQPPVRVGMASGRKHRVPRLRRRPAHPALPLRARALLHHLRLRQPASLSARGRARWRGARQCRRHQHRRPGRHRGRAAVRVRPVRLAQPTGPGAGRLLPRPTRSRRNSDRRVHGARQPARFPGPSR